MAVTRTIHTGLYSDRAFKILYTLFGDALTHYKNCKKTMNIRSLCAMKCERNIDNEIVFTGAFEQWCFRNTRVFNNMSDENVLNHLAWIFKNMFLHVVVDKLYDFSEKSTIKDFRKKFWNRKNAYAIMMFNGLEVNASEVYYLYEHLKNHKRLNMHYAAELIEQMVGNSLDPITVEMKNTVNIEIQRLEEERDRKAIELYSQKQNELKTATDTINKKFNKLDTDMRNEYHLKILALHKELESLVAAV